MRAGNEHIGRTTISMLANQRKLDLMADFEIQALQVGVITQQQCDRTENETDWQDREVHKLYRLWLAGVRTGKDEGGRQYNGRAINPIAENAGAL